MKLLSEIFDKVRDDAREFIDAIRGGNPSDGMTIRRGPPPMGGPVDMLVIDISGSMGSSDYSPTRLDGAMEAGGGFLEQLQRSAPKTSVGLVKFGSRAKVVARAQPVGDSLKSLRRAVQGLKTDGSTNIGDGLRLAVQEIERVKGATRPRILLLTDGDSNSGPDPIKVSKSLKSKGDSTGYHRNWRVAR